MSAESGAVSEASRLRRVWDGLWREWVRPLLAAALVLGSLRSAVADWNDVPTGSMKPTILEGDRIFVNKLAFDLKVPFTTWHLAEWAQPERGDIVVLFSPLDGTRLVKRVVAVAGDRVELRDSRLLVNGLPASYETVGLDSVPGSEPGDVAFGPLARETSGSRSHLVIVHPTLSAGVPDYGPVVVPEGRYFMMGDNRDNSLDSRWFGPVERQRIVGRATRVVLSFDRDRHFRPRWGRFFSPLS
jgi:signal peptidase I